LLAHEWTRAVAELARAGEAFDLVFVDPPFPRDCSAAVLAKLVQLDLLKLGGIVIIRQFHRAPALDGAGLECLNCATLGDHRIAFYRRAAAAVIADGTTGHGE
jgi:16S rRNA G966 N2-methylase RsmD